MIYRAVVLGAAAALAGISGAAGAASAADDTVAVEWQHRHASFNYFGVTVLYSCDGLEGQVRRILVYLGARSDLKVTAGCARGPDELVHDAWVDLDFSVPVPANTAAAGALRARWTHLELSPEHPNFMSRGDCELMQTMKDMVTKNFSTQGLDYKTSCFPGELTFDGFAVKGELLETVLPKTLPPA